MHIMYVCKCMYVCLSHCMESTCGEYSSASCPHINASGYARMHVCTIPCIALMLKFPYFACARHAYGSPAHVCMSRGESRSRAHVTCRGGPLTCARHV